MTVDSSAQLVEDAHHDHDHDHGHGHEHGPNNNVNLTELLIPLPTEAIEVGLKWTGTKDNPIAQIPITTEYTITAISEDKVDISYVATTPPLPNQSEPNTATGTCSVERSTGILLEGEASATDFGVKPMKIYRNNSQLHIYILYRT